MSVIERIGTVHLPSTLIGLDVTERQARAVELTRRGGLLGRVRFEAARYCTAAFPEASTNTGKGALVREQLEAAGIRSRVVCANIRSLGVRTVTASLPPGVESVADWISENAEKLVRVPVSLSEFSWSYEMMRDEATQSTVEVTFVRNADRDALLEMCHHAGLQVLGLSAGTRDAVNPLLLDERGAATFLYVENNILSTTTIENGIRTEHTTLMLMQESGPDTINTGSPGQHHDRVFIAGEVTGRTTGRIRYTPFALEPEYALAAGLALKGYLPDLSPTNLLREEESAEVSVTLQRRFFQRLSLALGSVLLALLLMQTAATYGIQQKVDELEESLLLSSAEYQQLEVLQQQVETMERRLLAARTNGSSEFARALHSLALLVPDSVWLIRVTVERQQGGRTSVSVTGATPENTHVTTFLKHLGANGMWRGVSLVRSGVSDDLVKEGRGRRTSTAVSFELKGNITHAR